MMRFHREDDDQALRNATQCARGFVQYGPYGQVIRQYSPTLGHDVALTVGELETLLRLARVGYVVLNNATPEAT